MDYPDEKSFETHNDEKRHQIIIDIDNCYVNDYKFSYLQKNEKVNLERKPWYSLFN